MEDPLVRTMGEGNVLLFRKSKPGLMEDLCRMSVGDLKGGIRGAAIEDDNLIGVRTGGKHFLEVSAFVFCY